MMLLTIYSALQMKRAALAVLIGVSCLSANAVGQERPSWVVQVERVLRAKESKWRISGKDVRSAEGYFHQTINLKAGALRADVVITILDSPQRAAEQFEGEKIAFTNILSKTASKSTLEGLGDESFMFTGKRGRRHGNIFIRQGNILVKVFAPSAETAIRFANYVADLMPSPQIPTNTSPR